MSTNELSTGQAARLCSVTPDTVLRWIKRGRLGAIRTPGGHYRVSRKELMALQSRSAARPVRYCWEYNAENREPLEGCEECIVYKARALRCYELTKPPYAADHKMVYCEASCDECDYYRLVSGQSTNVLVVTTDEETREKLLAPALTAPFNLEFVSSGYKLSALVERFRPDFVVIDMGLGESRAKEIAEHLQTDSRLQLVRIIMATGRSEIPKECEEEVFAWIEKPLSLDRLEKCLLELKRPLW